MGNLIAGQIFGYPGLNSGSPVYCQATSYPFNLVEDCIKVPTSPPRAEEAVAEVLVDMVGNKPTRRRGIHTPRST